jgi:hypothetical protein
MSAASPEVSLGGEGAARRSLCHGLGRMVNNLTMPRHPTRQELALEEDCERVRAQRDACHDAYGALDNEVEKNCHCMTPSLV